MSARGRVEDLPNTSSHRKARRPTFWATARRRAIAARPIAAPHETSTPRSRAARASSLVPIIGVALIFAASLLLGLVGTAAAVELPHIDEPEVKSVLQDIKVVHLPAPEIGVGLHLVPSDIWHRRRRDGGRAQRRYQRRGQRSLVGPCHISSGGQAKGRTVHVCSLQGRSCRLQESAGTIDRRTRSSHQLAYV